MSDYTSIGRSVTADDAGNVYASGAFYGSEITFGPHTLTNDAVGYAAAYLVKYDADGNVLWAAGSEGDGSAEVAGMATDGAGNTVVCGYFGFYGSFISLDGNLLDCAGESDGFIARYDPAGAVQWVLGFGGEGSEGVSGVALDSDGNVFATGTFRSDSISFGAFTLHNQPGYGRQDLFVVELDPDGNVIWALSEGSEYYPDDVFGTAIAVDPTGAVIVTGSFDGIVDFGGTILTSLGALGTTDVCLLKYTASGDLVWAQKFGGTGTDSGEDVVTDSDGNIYVAGDLESAVCQIGSTWFFNPAAPDADVFIAKCDPDGTVLWADQGWGWGYESIGGICMDVENQLHVTGYFTGDTVTFESTELITSNPGWGNTDIFLVTVDADGGPVNAEHPIGVDGYSEAHDVVADPDGNVIIVGYSACPELVFDGNVVVDPDDNGVCFAAKLGAITTDVPLHDNTNAIGIHPDPVVDHMIVTGKDPISVNDRIELLDMDGRIVRSVRGNGTHEVRIERDDLRSGMFLLRILPASGSLLRQIGLAGVARVVLE